MDSDCNTHVSIFNSVTETHTLHPLQGELLLTRGKNDLMWLATVFPGGSAVDTDDTIRADALLIYKQRVEVIPDGDWLSVPFETCPF